MVGRRIFCKVRIWNLSGLAVTAIEAPVTEKSLCKELPVTESSRQRKDQPGGLSALETP